MNARNYREKNVKKKNEWGRKGKKKIIDSETIAFILAP
jgi:hypothetical protein